MASAVSASTEGPRHTALKLATLTGLAAIANMIVSIPSRLISAAVLGTGGYGLTKIAEVISDYAGYADLGLRYSLTRQVPLVLGAGDRDAAEAIKRVVFTWTWVVSTAVVVLLCGLFATGMTFKGLLSLPNLILLSIWLITERFNAYLHSLAKGVGRFDVIGQNTLRLSILTPVIGLPAVVLWGVSGFLSSQLLLKLYVAVFYVRYLRKSEVLFPRLSLPVAKLVELSKIGLLLWAIHMSETVYWTIGLTLVTFFLAAEDVGLFGFAVGLLSLAVGIAGPFSMVAYRHMLTERGARRNTDDPDIFRKYLQTPLVSFLLIVSITLGFTFFGYECAVRLFLPKFMPAMPAAKTIVLGYMLFSSTYFTGAVLNVADHLGRRLGIVWCGLALNGLLDVLLLYKGYGIQGAAWGAAISYAVYSGAFLVSCSRMVYGKYRMGITFLARLLMICMVLFFILHVLDGWRMGPRLLKMPWVLGMSAEIGFAGLKVLLYASTALCLYSALFAAYRPLNEVLSSARFVIRYMTGGTRQRFAGL